jgi:hypothetical protein
MPAKPRRLVVPPFERLHAGRLRLAERIPEVVEEAIGIRFREPADELVAIPDERGVAPVGVTFEHDRAERKRFGKTARRRGRSHRNFDDHRCFRREARSGHSAGHLIGTGLQHLAVVGR